MKWSICPSKGDFKKFVKSSIENNNAFDFKLKKKGG